MRHSERRARFREVLTGSACVFPGSVFDPISARIAEDLGFEVGMFAGSVASMTVLGAPDLIVLTLSEFADQAARICRAGGLPLLVDADHGYGNALNVMRTVEELETAGIAALSIEDTELPQPFGAAKARLTSLEEGVGKMRAALEARRDTGLVIAGRTSALAMAEDEESGLAEALKRAEAYQACGVDALFFVGARSRAQVEALHEALKLPMILGGLPAELMDRDWLASQGVRVCLQGHQPFMAAVQAVHDTLKALREGTAPKELAGVAGKDLMARVTRDADYARWTEGFLG
jgi:carboxyvinyl-carboxyphosphonate phosphorylmutase